MGRILKPKIFKQSTIGKNKWDFALRSTNHLGTREVALYSFPGKKPIDVSFGRDENKVTLAHKRVERIYKEGTRNLSKTQGKQRTSRAGILHTHIADGTKYVALPSVDDILTTIDKYNRTRHGYELIGVVDQNKNRLGYTTLKINIPKIKQLREDLLMNEFNDFVYGSKNNVTLLDKISLSIHGHTIKTKIDLYKLLPELGFEIYFTPMNGYKLDKAYNYVKK